MIMSEASGREQLQEKLGLRDRKSFMDSYINPAIEGGYIEMTTPDKPTSKKLKYKLTAKGKKFRQSS